MIGFIMKGIDLKNSNLTRNPRIWLEYLCWCIQYQMSVHKPYYPGWVRGLVLKYYPHANERWSIHWNMVRIWQQVNPDWQITPNRTPLPWYIGTAAFGPFIIPWEAVQRWFRSHTGGRSHRCEFTDKSNGVLYGGQDGGYMERYFEQFIANISADDSTDNYN
jgi:hypothetical protein